MRKKLYIWRLEQNDNNGWDTYDSCVVVSESEIKAKQIHPAGDDRKYDEENEYWYIICKDGIKISCYKESWANIANNVKAIRIGIADESLNEGYVICASFNSSG